MDRQAQISEIIRTISKKNTTPDPDESLFDSGLLDSFALPDVLSALEKASPALRKKVIGILNGRAGEVNVRVYAARQD